MMEGMQMHAEQSWQRAQRVKQVIDQMGAQMHPVECHAVQETHQELHEAKEAKPSQQVMDGLVAGGAVKTEHYEIAAYTGLVEQAKAMGQRKAALLLD